MPSAPAQIVVLLLSTLPIQVHPRACVVGAGIAGATVALELERRNVPVTLIEATGSLRSSTSATITATVNLERFQRDFTSLNLDNLEDGYAFLKGGFSGTSHIPALRWAQFLSNAAGCWDDPRRQEQQQANFYNLSFFALRRLADRVEQVRDNVRVTGVGNSTNSLLKLYSEEDCRDIRARVKDSAEYEFFNFDGEWPYLFPTSTGVACAVRPQERSGHVYTTSLFAALEKLFNSPDNEIDLYLNSTVTKIHVADNKTVTLTARQIAPDGANSTVGFTCTKVFVAASLNSSALVSRYEPHLKANLIGFLGWGLTYDAPSAPFSEEFGNWTHHSVKFEERAVANSLAYMRPLQIQESENVTAAKAWGGNFPTGGIAPQLPTDEEVAQLVKNGEAVWPGVGASSFLQGIRPVSACQVPLLKVHADATVILVTGYAYWGYDFAWAGAECAVALAYDGANASQICKIAAGDGPETDVWGRWFWIAVALAVLGVVVLVSIAIVLWESPTRASSESTAFSPSHHPTDYPNRFQTYI